MIDNDLPGIEETSNAAPEPAHSTELVEGAATAAEPTVVAAPEAAKSANGSEQMRQAILDAIDTVDPTHQVQEIRHKATVAAPYSREGNIAGAPTLSMPSDFDSAIERRIRDAPNVAVDGSQQGEAWVGAITGGAAYVPQGEMLKDLLEDQDEEFTNRLTNGSEALFSGYPPTKSQGGRELKGEQAVNRVMSSIGAGRRHQTALYSSGFYVTFKPPSESALLELNRILLSDDIKLGRSSYALLMSSLTGVTVERIVQIATEHIYETSVVRSDMPFEDVPKYVKSQDIHSFIWGFLCARYSDGFNFERACTTSPGKCDAIERAILNLNKLQWPRSKAFKLEMLTHMARRRAGAMTMAQVKAYQNAIDTELTRSFDVKSPSTGEINRFHLRDPSMTDFFDNTNAWIQGIETSSIRALGTEANPRARNAFVTSHGQASVMQQYGHWVERIEILNELDPDNPDVISDRESINTSLASYSSQKDIREGFIKGVKKYITDSTMAIIAIPAYDCPVCKGPQEDKTDVPEFKNLIALDLLQVFFELLSQMTMDVNKR